MYVLGHCVTAERTGLFSADLVFGEGIASVMMPDYLRSHDWGYGCCFDRRFDGTEAALMHSHLLGDWFVHFGDTPQQVKRGWAYRNMGVFARIYDEFFEAAETAGLRDPRRPRDSRRGFSHTMAEYAVDLHLARTGEYDHHLPTIRARLGTLGGAAGVCSRGWIVSTARSIGAPIYWEMIDDDIADFGGRIHASRSVGEFVLRAAVKKFGLEVGDAAIEYVRAHLERGLDEIGGESVEAMLTGATEFLQRELTGSVS